MVISNGGLLGSCVIFFFKYASLPYKTDIPFHSHKEDEEMSQGWHEINSHFQRPLQYWSRWPNNLKCSIGNKYISWFIFFSWYIFFYPIFSVSALRAFKSTFIKVIKLAARSAKILTIPWYIPSYTLPLVIVSYSTYNMRFKINFNVNKRKFPYYYIILYYPL